MTKLAMLTLDCAEVTPVTDFWKAALGYEQLAGDGENYAMLGNGSGPALGFGTLEDHQPPGWPNEHGSKQFHLDLAVDDLDGGRPSGVGLGATLPTTSPARPGGCCSTPAATRSASPRPRTGADVRRVCDQAVTSRNGATDAIRRVDVVRPDLSRPRNRARE